LGIEFFIWFVGAFTLLAGALGVSNIMLISVRERTVEFGVRKALGATPWSVVSLVLKEAALLTTLAGYAGLVAAVVALEAVSRFFAEGGGPLGTPSVDFRVALGATAVLALAGVLAGVAPARRAARIRPVEALRAE
jgi:putative ABC transport system permease protein